MSPEAKEQIVACQRRDWESVMGVKPWMDEEQRCEALERSRAYYSRAYEEIVGARLPAPESPLQAEVAEVLRRARSGSVSVTNRELVAV